jgi:hypothetical protein
MRRISSTMTHPERMAFLKAAKYLPSSPLSKRTVIKPRAGSSRFQIWPFMSLMSLIVLVEP